MARTAKAADVTEKEKNSDKENLKTEAAKQLTAVYPILFESHQYSPGDILPTHNQEMNEAWVKSGTAAWMTVMNA